MKPIIKVCRVFDASTAIGLARYGVDFIGLHAIFDVPDPQTIKTYQQIIATMRSFYPQTHPVLVTRVTDPEKLANIYLQIPTDFVQISGPCSGEDKMRFLSLVRNEHDSVELFNVISANETRDINSEDIIGDYVIIDKEFAGGTGQIISKQKVEELTVSLQQKVVLLAGGIGSTNTHRHLEGLSVAGVDVMSALEISKDDKRKDMNKVVAFLKNVWGTLPPRLPEPAYEDDELSELQFFEHPSMHTPNTPVFWERAEGSYVYDTFDRRWIDFTSSIAVANAGHSNTIITNAIREALDSKLLTTYTFPHRQRLFLHRRMRTLMYSSTNAGYKFHFMSAGTEAVEVAIDAIVEYAHNQKTVIVSFFNAFHGNTLKSSASSGIEPYSFHRYHDGRQVYFVKLPYVSRQSENPQPFVESLNSMLSELDLSPDDVAGVMVEPYQGRGVFVADHAFIQDIRDFCEEHEALLIFDEIQSGFYRTGTRFAFEQFDVLPDIVCMGKGLTSSLPMSAIAVKDRVFDALSDLDIASTHSANPLACAAALASITVLENPKLKVTLAALTQMLAESLREARVKYSGIIDYSETFGMVGSLHFVKQGLHSEAVAKRVVRLCFENGLLVTGPHGIHHSFIRITPPLTMSEEELSHGLRILHNVLLEVSSELSTENS